LRGIAALLLASPHLADNLRTVKDLAAKTLLAVHRRVDKHPRVRRCLATIVNRSVGERRVNAAILNIIQPGDCVWDVGAHTGEYARQFLEQVGPNGQVVAFEPIPRSAALVGELGSEPQLVVVEAALADTDGQTSFVVTGPTSSTSGTSHIGDSPEGVKVRVARGDSLLDEGFRQPDVVKIDVEGFEGDVLNGMPAVLSKVREVVVEVHFAALTERGIPDDPLRILNLLRDKGFGVRWLDPSHLLASR
jgi:FkbM family methyltransferase